MIWESTVLMTLIDLVIVSVTMASLWILFGHRYRLIRSNLILGSSIVVVGLVTIGLFYLTDLFVMLVLPSLSSKPTAMALMEDLHLYYSWIVMLVGTVSIFAGFAIMNRKLFSLIDSLERSEANLSRELSTHQETDKALREGEERTQAIMETALDAVITMDSQGLIIGWNVQAEVTFGWSRQEAVGKHLSSTIVPPQHREAHVHGLQHYLATGEGPVLNKRIEITALHRDGHEFPVELAIAPVQMHGALIFSAFVQDISERKRSEHALEERVQLRTVELSKANNLLKQEIDVRQQAEKAMERAKEEAEEANRAKSNFLANMSHELRTPLNGILGYAQILKRDKGLNARQQSGVEVVQQSGEYLLTLINDLLDLSKIEAQKLELELTTFHLPEFLQHIAGLTRVRAEQKRLSLIYEPISPLPTWVRGDEKRLRQVLLNLLGNAIKFTETGQVVFKAGVHHDSTVSKLRFQVEDTGRGIAPEMLGEIFAPFQQVSERSEQVEGTGLGLSISNTLVQLMGGELHVDSTPKKGSTFWVVLELPEVQNWQPGTSKIERNITGLKGDAKQILVVDDKWDNRSVLVNLLAPLGFKISEATNGQECLAKAIECRPDVVLMDLVMPVMDGFEATRRIRRSSQLKDVVVIALSASAFEHDRKGSMEAGCNDFLPKPVRAEELFEKLQVLLGLEWVYEEELPADGQVPPPEESQVAPPPEELAFLFNLAKKGEIVAIRQEIARIEQLGDPFIPFAAELSRLAKGFRMKQMCEFLKPHLEETE